MTSPKIKKRIFEDDRVAYGLDGAQLNPFFAEAFWRMLIKHIGLRRAENWLRAAYPRMKILDFNSQESSKARASSEPHDKALTFATEFWKRLVKAVGERQAKNIMHLVMDNKKTGRRGDSSMFSLIFDSVLVWPHEFGRKDRKAYC